MIFSCLSYRSQAINYNLKAIEQQFFKVWMGDGKLGRGRTFETDFSINEQCIWSHTHRMYLIGTNSISHPWIIPKDFPVDALSEVHKDRLTMFIDSYNTNLQWTFLETYSFWTISVLYYALSKPYHTYIRERKFQKL